jgi:hypothetical protein
MLDSTLKRLTEVAVGYGKELAKLEKSKKNK